MDGRELIDPMFGSSPAMDCYFFVVFFFFGFLGGFFLPSFLRGILPSSFLITCFL